MDPVLPGKQQLIHEAHNLNSLKQEPLLQSSEDLGTSSKATAEFTSPHTPPGASAKQELLLGLLTPVTPAAQRLLCKYPIYPFPRRKWGMA